MIPGSSLGSAKRVSRGSQGGPGGVPGRRTLLLVLIALQMPRTRHAMYIYIYIVLCIWSHALRGQATRCVASGLSRRRRLHSMLLPGLLRVLPPCHGLAASRAGKERGYKHYIFQ